MPRHREKRYCVARCYSKRYVYLAAWCSHPSVPPVCLLRPPKPGLVLLSTVLSVCLSKSSILFQNPKVPKPKVLSILVLSLSCLPVSPPIQRREKKVWEGANRQEGTWKWHKHGSMESTQMSFVCTVLSLSRPLPKCCMSLPLMYVCLSK